MCAFSAPEYNPLRMPPRQVPAPADFSQPRPHTRDRQRRRTRKAIVDAAAALIARGETPSVSDIAAAADVSRRTVYLYFPTLEQLLLDATIGMLTQSAIDQVLDDNTDASTSDIEARVERMITALGNLILETLPLGRSLIRLTVDGPLHDTTDAPPDAPRRGYRRIEWIERVVAPLRDRLDDQQFERLVSALAVVIGWEAFIVLGDIRALSSAEQVQVSTWAARALMRAALEEGSHAAKS
jgi:AcrR family transcriptional regulator